MSLSALGQEQTWKTKRSLVFNDESSEEDVEEKRIIVDERKNRSVKIVLLRLLAKLQERSRSVHGGRPYPIAKKKRRDFWRIVGHFSGRQFRNAFRMTVTQFRRLTAELEPILSQNKHMAQRSSGPLQTEVKATLFLRILAGACYQDMCLIFRIPPSSVYKVFHRCLEAVLQTFSLPGIPTEEEKLKTMALRFRCSRRGGSPLDGCIGALDGIAIKIRKPCILDHPSLYYCRKQFYAIPVQAMVDADYRFRYFSAVCVGSTHDSLSHSVSMLGKCLREGKLIGPFSIAADEAYICTECLLTPFAQSQMDRSVIPKYKDSYNFFHSSLRMHVEQAFGMLVARFGIIWKHLGFSLQANTKIVLADMILHNFCIDNSARNDVMPASEKRKQKRAFSLWYDRCREELGNLCETVLTAESAGTDRAMAKSRGRRSMVQQLQYLPLPRPYGQHRFDREADEN